jgi:hypothetical protein
MGDWRRLLRTPDDDETLQAMRRHGRTGRPWGETRFLDRVESLLGRRVRKAKPGPKPPHGRGN